jgi:simple sugar transport system permease protein
MSETISDPREFMPDEMPEEQQRSRWSAAARSIGAPILGVLAGLLVGAILIWLAGDDPVTAYKVMLEGAFGGQRQITETILKAVPLLIMALGLTVAFRSKMWNIGGEGQYFLGALGGVIVGLAFQDSLPAVILIPLMLLASMVGGALWAGLAVILKIKFGISEIISTIMLNFIAEFFILFLAREPMKDPESYLPQTAALRGAARLPTLLGTRLNVGVIIALLLVPLVYVLLWKMPIGLRIRAIGSNQRVAKYAGMNVIFGLSFAMMFSGALAGITGIIEVSTLHLRLQNGISGGYGFTGILVALLGRLHPIGVLIAAFFFAALSNGAQTMHSIYGMPISLAQVIQGLIVIFVLAADALARRWWR